MHHGNTRGHTEAFSRRKSSSEFAELYFGAMQGVCDSFVVLTRKLWKLERREFVLDLLLAVLLLMNILSLPLVKAGMSY